MHGTRRETTGHRQQRYQGPCKPITLFTRRLVLALSLLLLAPAVMAQTPVKTELQKLLASDAAEYDEFGYSVSVSGNRALVGAIRDDDAGFDAGAAYVFERDGTGSWVERAKLTASDPAANGFFGRGVSLSGDRALVGAWLDGDANKNTGAAYVFERDGTGSWVERAKLTASDAEEFDDFRYGTSLSLSGDRALVGASYTDDDASEKSGSVYVFERDGTGSWVERAKLIASDAAAFGNFAPSVSLSDDRALVGVSTYNDAVGNRTGSAYVFERDGTGSWIERVKLTSSDAAARDFFGWSVSISGDRALVGAFADDDAGITAGSAYVFERDGAGSWVERAKLIASDAAAFDQFGRSVSISGDRALVGARLDEDAGSIYADSDSGAAYLFERDSTGNWVERAKLIASDGAGFDELGGSVSLSGDRALVGSQDNLSLDKGSVYVFDVAGLGDLPQLAIGVTDSDRYGFRYDGVNDHREVLELTFAASGTGLLLSVSGFDIDVANEVRVLVNGTVIGYLAKTPDNGSGVSELAIAQSLLNSTGNTLRFEQRNPGWIWGVTDLLLSESEGAGELPPLILDSVDSAKYGFRFNGIESHIESLERQFEASGTDLLLTLDGFDIDVIDEVRVLVNGTEIGFLRKTPNNGRRDTQLIVPQSLLNSTGNTLRFEQSNPGWIWGVTDLLLRASDTGL